jgi:NDP-sugar pyrophosphorylase family protein
MSFEKSIREDLSDIPVLFFLGGEGTRMEDLAYKHILPSKQWLPIGFDENNEPIPLFWRNFEILFELGFKEFYIIIKKEGEKVKKYFEKKLKGKEVNIQLLNKESLLKQSKIEGVNIYIFENYEEGIGDQILALESVIKNRLFLKVYGDEYFGGEKEKVKSEFKSFIEYALEKIEKEKAIEVFAFVDKKIAIGNIWKGLGIEGDKREGKIIKIDESSFMITSISIISPKFLDILHSEKKEFIPLDVNSKEVDNKVYGSQMAYGKVIDVEVFSNVNTDKDYSKLVSYLANKNYNDRKLKSTLLT